MDTYSTLVTAALKVLEERGEAQFSTRAVCAIANVTAPTLYHHFGSADGLLSAAIARAFEQFLAGKKAAIQSSDPVVALKQGWDNYVSFAAKRPRLYAAMLARFLQGADIPAARQALEMLGQRIAAIEAAGRLAIAPAAASHVAWASANAAALLYTVAAQSPREQQKPAAAVVASLRDNAIRCICAPQRRSNRL